MEELLTPRQAATILHMSVQFVREHAEELGVVRMGRSLRFTESGLKSFISSRRAVRHEATEGAQSERLA